MLGLGIMLASFESVLWFEWKVFVKRFVNYGSEVYNEFILKDRCLIG